MQDFAYVCDAFYLYSFSSFSTTLNLLMRHFLYLIAIFIFLNLHDDVIASSDERNKKSVEEQHKIIHESLNELNRALAQGRRRQTNRARFGKFSEKNANLAKKNVEQIGKEMENIKESYDEKVGIWIKEGASKNAAVPNKDEKPLYLIANSSIREANQLHHHWVDRLKWPSTSWNRDHIAHQHASAKQVSIDADLQLRKSKEEKKRRASIS